MKITEIFFIIIKNFNSQKSIIKLIEILRIIILSIFRLLSLDANRENRNV